MPPEYLAPADLLIDVRYQPRAALDTATVEEYADMYRDEATGALLPPLGVIRTKRGANIVWDGFHRHAAALQAGKALVPCLVEPGDEAKAFLRSLGANAQHGLRRTNADKRRAVERAVEEWPEKSDRDVAEACRVSHTFVGIVRRPEQPRLVEIEGPIEPVILPAASRDTSTRRRRPEDEPFVHGGSYSLYPEGPQAAYVAQEEAKGNTVLIGPLRTSPPVGPANPWPPALAVVFNGFRDEVELTIGDAKELRRLITKLLDIAAREPRLAQVAALRTEMEDAIDRLTLLLQRYALPAGPCPYCLPAGNPGCVQCKGGGWAPLAHVDDLAGKGKKGARW